MIPVRVALERNTAGLTKRRHRSAHRMVTQLAPANSDHHPTSMSKGLGWLAGMVLQSKCAMKKVDIERAYSWG